MVGVGSLMLLDTASLYYRAFFGVPDTVRAPDGTPVNAVRGLLDMIGRLVRARHAHPAGRVPGRGLAAGLPRRGGALVQGAPARRRRHLGGDTARAGRADPGDRRGAARLRAGGRRAAGVRGGRRDGHALRPVGRPGGRGHRRPGPVPARRRRAGRPGHLHRARAAQHGRDRRGGGDREVRHPGPRLRRLRRAARRPERRAARRAGRGGEDRGRADQDVRQHRGDQPPRWTRATAGSRAAAGTSSRRPGTTWTSPCRWSSAPTTPRCPTSTGSCRWCPPTPAG